MEIITDTYQKVLNFYDYLKGRYAKRELKIIEVIEKATGNMWNPEDKQILLDQKRPALSYNLIEPMRNALVGTERTSRVNMKAVPYAGGSSDVAQMLTEAMYWNYNQCGYDWEKSKQFIHTIFGGVGWGHDYWDYRKGHWVFKAFDALRIRWDDTCRSLQLDDCHYMQDTQWMTAQQILSLPNDNVIRKEAEYRLKFLEPANRGNVWYEKQYSGGSWNDVAPSREQEEFTDFRAGRYRVIDHHEKRDTTTIVLLNSQTGEKVDATKYPEEIIGGFLEKHPEYERFDIVEQELWHTIIVPAIQMAIVEEPYPEGIKNFAYKPEVAYDIKPYLVDAQGVFDNVIDINDSFNKRQSVLLEYAMDSVGGDWIAEDGAIDDYMHEWKTRAKTFVKRYKSGHTAPTRSQPGQVPATMFQYAQQDAQLIESILGISKNYRGFKESSAETGVLFDSKIKQSEIMHQHIFDNMALSQQLDADSCIQHIKAFMSPTQLLELVASSPELNSVLPSFQSAVQQLKEGKFKVAIDRTRPSATGRQESFQRAMQMIQYMPGELVNWKVIAELADMPNKSEWIEYIDKVTAQAQAQVQTSMPQGGVPVQ